ncbi:MAG: universal stress protein [Acidobacteriia bacterium]|nr:universal stress protein [Terriglobia bacterium]
MFKKILVALDHSKADTFLLPRVKELARLTGAEILLLHVSTGWAAQWQENLNLSDSQEIKEDREYLERVSAELRGENFQVTLRHESGEPARAILKTVQAEHCDLIAMATHGHRLISDLIHGTTITRVRHESTIPLFLVRAEMN